jgi:hypothetical protein
MQRNGYMVTQTFVAKGKESQKPRAFQPDEYVFVVSGTESSIGLIEFESDNFLFEVDAAIFRRSTIRKPRV